MSEIEYCAVTLLDHALAKGYLCHNPELEVLVSQIVQDSKFAEPVLDELDSETRRKLLEAQLPGRPERVLYWGTAQAAMHLANAIALYRQEGRPTGDNHMSSLVAAIVVFHNAVVNAVHAAWTAYTVDV